MKMATTNSKLMFFQLLLVLIVCSSVQGATANIFQIFRRELMIKTIQRLVFDPSISSPALLTGHSRAPMNAPAPAPNSFLPPLPNPIHTPAPAPSPVTTPAPIGDVPSVAPSPAGEVWCVANNGSRRVTLQNALDYACGNGADCSAIQPGAVCFNPDTLESHASYAFNSYYHNNPVQTSCDFEGLATITNVNPSYGACVYASTMPAPNTTSPPPSVPNAGVPGDGGGGGGTTGVADSPQSVPTSMSSGLQPFISWIIAVTCFVTVRIVQTV